MSREVKEAAVHSYIQCLNTKDISIIEKLYTEGATVEDPVGSDPIVGHSAVVAFYQDIAFPRVQLAELTGPVRCVSNGAAFPFKLTLDVEGKQVFIEAIDVFEFDGENRVVSMKAYWG